MINPSFWFRNSGKVCGVEYPGNTDDAITGSKIADGTLVTAHYAAGSVDQLDSIRFTPHLLFYCPSISRAQI